MDTREMQVRIWSIFVFFIIGIGFSVASITKPILISGAVLCLSFMCFSGFMLVSKLIISSTKLLTEMKRRKR